MVAPLNSTPAGLKLARHSNPWLAATAGRATDNLVLPAPLSAIAVILAVDTNSNSAVGPTAPPAPLTLTPCPTLKGWSLR